MVLVELNWHLCAEIILRTPTSVISISTNLCSVLTTENGFSRVYVSYLGILLKNVDFEGQNNYPPPRSSNNTTYVRLESFATGCLKFFATPSLETFHFKGDITSIVFFFFSVGYGSCILQFNKNLDNSA